MVNCKFLSRTSTRFKHDTNFLQLRTERRDIEPWNKWTIRATLAVPLDREELLDVLGIGVGRNSLDQAESVPSAVMEPLEASDEYDWLLSFGDCEFESTDGKLNSFEHSPLPEDVNGTTMPKQLHAKHSMSPEVLYMPINLTVMRSEEGAQQRRQVNEDLSDNKDAMSVGENEDIEASSNFGNSSKGTINATIKQFYAQDGPREIKNAAPSMTDTPTTCMSSDYSEASSATPSSRMSSNLGTGVHTCPQCPKKSFPRPCDLT